MTPRPLSAGEVVLLAALTAAAMVWCIGIVYGIAWLCT